LSFCQFLECQTPLHKPKGPYCKLSGDGSAFNTGQLLKLFPPNNCYITMLRFRKFGLCEINFLWTTWNIKRCIC